MITKNEYIKKKTVYEIDVSEIKNELKEDEDKKIALLKKWAIDIIKKDIDDFSSKENNFDIEAFK